MRRWWLALLACCALTGCARAHPKPMAPAAPGTGAWIYEHRAELAQEQIEAEERAGP